MIYLDTSVMLAWLLAEDRRPDDALWNETLVASRLLEYEVWTRLHARNLFDSLGESARNLLGRVAFVEMAPRVLGRAVEGFPLPVRTLDALHLASFSFLLESGQAVRLASYDQRMLDVAQALDWPLVATDFLGMSAP